MDFLVTVLLIITVIFGLSRCSEKEGTYRITYGTWLNYTEVKNVETYTLRDNCITYTYGTKKETETYCGDNISVLTIK